VERWRGGIAFCTVLELELELELACFVVIERNKLIYLFKRSVYVAYGPSPSPPARPGQSRWPAYQAEDDSSRRLRVITCAVLRGNVYIVIWPAPE